MRVAVLHRFYCIAESSPWSNTFDQLVVSFLSGCLRQVLLYYFLCLSVSRLQASSRLNTGTFTRPKKNKDKPSPEENNVDDMKENVEQPKQYPKVEDIENLAKLQEESKLR